MMRRVWVVLAAIALAIPVSWSANASNAVSRTAVGLVTNLHSSVSVPSDGGDTTCTADISGVWKGKLEFGVLREDGKRYVVGARAHPGVGLVAATSSNGDFVWQASDVKACQVMMISYRRGRMVAYVNASDIEVATEPSPADPPSYVTWYTPVPSPWPTPISGAYVGIGGALGAGNMYNTATNGVGVSGTGMLGTGECFFLCYGGPGVASSNVLSVGTDVSSSYSFMTLGAPDDCQQTIAPLCPGGIADKVFSIESYASATATPTVLVAIDASANLAVFNGIYVGQAVIAGAPAGTPGPLPATTAGSLVSFTGNGKHLGAGELLLGSSANYVKCDYDETNESVLTCNQRFIISSGGIQPNGASGGYAPEALPLGTAETHPQIMTGTCSVTVPFATCTFPSSFQFPDTGYNCTISAQGTSAAASSYSKSSKTVIVIYSNQSATFSYTCME